MKSLVNPTGWLCCATSPVCTQPTLQLSQATQDTGHIWQTAGQDIHGVHLGGGAELQVCHIVCCKALHNLSRDPGDGLVRGGESVDEVKQLEAVTE